MQGAATVVLYPPPYDDESSNNSDHSLQADGADGRISGTSDSRSRPARSDTTAEALNGEECDNAKVLGIASDRSSIENNNITTTTTTTTTSKKRQPSNSSGGTAMSSKLAENFEVLKRAKLSEEHGSKDGGTIDESCRRKLAAETAKLANDEIRKMERAVAELEALVREKNSSDAGRSDRAGSRSGSNKRSYQQRDGRLVEPFPALPKVIEIPRDDDDDDDGHGHDIADDVDGDVVAEGSKSQSPIVVAERSV